MRFAHQQRWGDRPTGRPNVTNPGRTVGFDSPTPAQQPELAAHNALRLKRERLGLSKRELGRRACLSAAYVSAFEAGNLRPSLNAFSRLAAELRLTPGEVFLIVQNAALENKDSEDG